ncbi:DUF2066 domain-containing protein [Aliidiomarina minuta]|uniref:DUF2066 domain-containing protein n=1 Tax=Aliidiomarina minuta TaxID=880057 RepID=UPI0013006E77|nr:DUF2066 domain-containing protein [Aliidiomarina minuta]
MRHWWLILIACWSFSLSADEVTDLYESRIEVATQSRDDRQDALREAFSSVLIKVSGQRDVLERPEVSRQLSQATNYLVQYSYVTERQQLYLRAQFDEQRIEELLRRANASYWSARRPNIIFWIAQETQRGARLIGRDADSEIVPAMRRQAHQRGLPISFPLLDLTDLSNLSASDVWGRFERPVQEASRRYPSDGLVMVRVQEGDNGQGYLAQWTLIVGNTRRSGQVDTEDLNGIGMAVVDSVTDRVAAEYAVSYSETEASEFTIRIINLQDLESVLLVESLLRRLASVEQATLARYHQGTAEFRLQLIGDMRRALQALELDNRMQRVEDPWSVTASPVLEYRWLR